MIRPATRNDATAWRALRVARWPGVTASEHALHLVHFFWSGSRDVACFVAEEHGGVVGFLELSLREEATLGQRAPVAHVDGWYVMPEWQGRGVGRALVAAGDAWARARGCEALTAHTPLDDGSDYAMHAALGFTPTTHLVQWRRDVGEEGVVQVVEPENAMEPMPATQQVPASFASTWPFARIVMRAGC